MRPLTIVISILLLSATQAWALSFVNENLEPGQRIKLSQVLEKTETHWDGILSSDWNDGFAGANLNYRFFMDYRIESHMPLYNLRGHSGRLVARVTGTGFLDDDIDTFFDDPLIDIPELYVQDDSLNGDNQLSLNFGKFALRRFAGKDEINPDPFDIGEMRFSGAIANTLNILSGINEFRDSDLRASGARFATGSYGFRFALKNKDMSGGLSKRWGYQQILAVNKLGQFGHNFLGISELNKNWGQANPGQFSTGFVYANQDVFRTANDGKNSYLFYNSLAQRINSKNSFYIRYGTLFDRLANQNSSINEYRFGVYTKWTKKFGSHIWLGYFDGDGSLGVVDDMFAWVNVFRYKLTDNLGAFFTTALRFNQPSPAAFDGTDANYTIALQLQYAR